MEKIYSRKRIQIPKLYFNRIPNGKIDIRKKKMLKASLILVIAILVMFFIVKSINPIINKLCLDESKKKATLISNQQATNVMSRYSYDDIVTIYRDSNDNITMLKSNIITINEITSDVAITIQEEFEKNRESEIYVKFGSLMGSKIFSGLGPNIPIKLYTSGTVETKLRSEFESTGINQTIHRLYLDVACDVSILTPYDVINNNISNEVLLIENVIVGIVPSTYYNLEGMDNNNLYDTVK